MAFRIANRTVDKYLRAETKVVTLRLNPVMHQESSAPVKIRHFIDLFAGCGGLSLGLTNAGWHGLFAVEKEKRAFSTLSFNLIERKENRFSWPSWLPHTAHTIEFLLENYGKELEKLARKVDLLAGGPPCQGFSSLGRRFEADPRNQMFRQYLKFVGILQPKLVVIENVRGILHPFKADDAKPHNPKTQETYADLIRSELENLGYEVWSDTVLSADYGVPQSRPRFILIAAHRDMLRSPRAVDPISILRKSREGFLREKGLDPNFPVSVFEALGDLISNVDTLEPCPENPDFKQGRHGLPFSPFQKLMHGSLNGALADSHRFANHRPDTVKKFEWFLKNCKPGKLEPDDRGEYANKKRNLYVLNPDLPAPTVTTLPDDLLHFNEPRILTVRETARLQSFPDWFEFKGKYTTGGKQRVKECPRYTQVGNAVPPLLAEAIGKALSKFSKIAFK